MADVLASAPSGTAQPVSSTTCSVDPRKTYGQPVPRNPHDVPCLFVNHPDQLVEIERSLDGARNVAIDTEVPIDGPRKHLLRVMSIAVRQADGLEQAFVVDARDVDPTLLAPVLAGVTADAWNANFDARVIDTAVWESSDTTPGLRWWDAQIADALIHQGRSGFTWFHGLAWATGHYLGIEAEGKGTIQLSYTAFDDLTEDQVAYAAADAVETLWVADAIRAEIAAAGLEQICAIEMSARPLLDRMERTGLPFDADGWRSELDDMAHRHRATLGRLAVLTGGGQGSLFDDVIEPSWNPASERQVRDALNQWSEAEVLAWTEHRHGKARKLMDLDSVTAGVLRSIGGELCETLLEFRSLSKILGTYGDSILDHLDDDGRMRPQYLQVVGTNTGRLASRNPNAQNFTPLMKPFVRPPQDQRVFVHADLSQAELRFLAQVADDEPLRAAFARGDDVHVTTAATMFGFDRDELERDDPARLKHLRQIAKALNFGIAYGTGAAALSRSLTSEGSATTVDEAKELLAQYRRTYPGTAAWAEARIAEIQQERENTVAIDWPLTLRLARGFPAVRDIRRHFRRTESRWPTAAEIAERHPDRDAPHSGAPGSDPFDLEAEIEWLLAYSAPVALQPDGDPFTFASRTVAGRRQQFNLHLDRLLLAVVVEAVADSSPAAVTVRRRFETEHDIDLWPNNTPPPENEIAKSFEERTMRLQYVDAIADELGADGAETRLRRAARERVSVMVNAWRNAPIQGGVADIMLASYGDLDARLADHPTALPVQTVHDSVVVECDLADADAVAESVRLSLEEASLRFCPDVAPKADVDIRRSLADVDVIRVHEPAADDLQIDRVEDPTPAPAAQPGLVPADRATVQGVLEADRNVHFYGLGDLGEVFWNRSTWWVRDGVAIGDIGLSDDPSDRTVYGINTGDKVAALDLWAEVDHLLPDRYWATGVLGFADRLGDAGRTVETDLGHHTKMVLTDRVAPALAVAMNGENGGPIARALTNADLPAIADLHEANPVASAFFAPALLDVGPFFGVFEGDNLISMAGVHVCDTEFSVAALGGVLTSSNHRSRGLARITTAAVAAALVELGIETIGLNVKTSNAAARSLYPKLGFTDVHFYQEAFVTR